MLKGAKMVKHKPKAGGTGFSADDGQIKILVRPDNVALIRPPAGQLRPLAEYQSFFIGKTDMAADDLDDEIDGPELSPSSAFPAGLLGRFQAALVAHGYHVTVDDRRSEEKLHVNEVQYRESYGEARAFLRAVRDEPLGQIAWQRWHDFLWRIGQLCYLYPEARVLIVADGNAVAVEVYNELYRDLRRWLGLLAADRVGAKPRCLVTTYRWLPVFKPGSWQVVLPIIFTSRLLSESTYRAVVRLRAQRVYALVPRGLRLGRATRLRLEAMSGGPLRTPAPPANELPPGGCEPAG